MGLPARLASPTLYHHDSLDRAWRHLLSEVARWWWTRGACAVVAQRIRLREGKKPFSAFRSDWGGRDWQLEL